MLKKKLLFILVIVQGILILAGIIAIVLGIFYKFNKSPSSLDKINQNIDLSQIFLLDENYYQQKIIKNNQVIFQIVEIKTNKILKEVIIDK
jgi:cell division protein YceG involved in septum cleavage